MKQIPTGFQKGTGKVTASKRIMRNNRYDIPICTNPFLRRNLITSALSGNLPSKICSISHQTCRHHAGFSTSEWHNPVVIIIYRSEYLNIWSNPSCGP